MGDNSGIHKKQRPTAIDNQPLVSFNLGIQSSYYNIEYKKLLQYKQQILPQTQ